MSSMPIDLSHSTWERRKSKRGQRSVASTASAQSTRIKKHMCRVGEREGSLRAARPMDILVFGTIRRSGPI